MVTIRDVLSSFIDFLYPPLCLSCSSLLLEGERYVCAECAAQYVRTDREGELYKEVMDRISSDGGFSDLVAPYVFEKRGPLQSMVHALKYQSVSEAGVELGREIGREYTRTGGTPAFVVPVPLHRAREREREYNQAERIARGLCEECSLTLLPDLVVRVSHTQTQTTLSAVERRKNVENAFRVCEEKRGAIRGETVIIVDDIVTTGATMCAVARVLRAAGAREVIAAAVGIAARE